MTEAALYARLRTQEEQVVRGRVIETRLEGDGAVASVKFPIGEAPHLEICEEVELVITGGALLTPHVETARVIFQGRKENECLYQFQLGLKSKTILSPALNRREAVRVHPSAFLPIKLKVLLKDGPHTVPALNDISISGLSFLSSPADERCLSREWELLLSLQLPDQGAPLEFVATVCYRRLSGSAIFHGIRFDPGATTDFDIKQAAVHQYIMARQSEMLGAARH